MICFDCFDVFISASGSVYGKSENLRQGREGPWGLSGISKSAIIFFQNYNFVSHLYFRNGEVLTCTGCTLQADKVANFVTKACSLRVKPVLLKGLKFLSLNPISDVVTLNEAK